MTTDQIQALAAAITALVAVVSAIYVLVQYKMSKRQHFDQRRPYVVAELEVDPARASADGVRVYLKISNYGLTSAKDVVLDFGNATNWNHLASDRHFPFLMENGGITLLTPGNSLSYMVGTLTAESPLQALRSESISVKLNYEAPGATAKVTDSSVLTLRNYIGSQRLPRQSRSTKKSPTSD